MKKLLVIFLILGSGLSFGQEIYDMSVRVDSVNEMIVKPYNLFSSKSEYWQHYRFDNKGRAINGKFYFKEELREEFVYVYNEHDLLTHQIKIFDINHKDKVDTLETKYILSEDNKVLVRKSILRPNDTLITKYLKHNENKLPVLSKVYHRDKLSTTWTYEYDSLSRLIKSTNQRDTSKTIETRKYNDNDDIIYSSYEYYPEPKEPNIYFGGGRLKPTENYRYVYDSLGRWTEKYLILEDKELLSIVREYK